MEKGPGGYGRGGGLSILGGGRGGFLECGWKYEMMGGTVWVKRRGGGTL